MKHFAILLYNPDDAETHSIATQLDAQAVASIKKAHLWRKQLRFEPKTVKKNWFFWGIQVYTKTLRNFTV